MSHLRKENNYYISSCTERPGAGGPANLKTAGIEMSMFSSQCTDFHVLELV